jgi:hypothetical protein
MIAALVGLVYVVLTQGSTPGMKITWPQLLTYAKEGKLQGPVEITESQVMRQTDGMILLLNRLAEMGVPEYWIVNVAAVVLFGVPVIAPVVGLSVAQVGNAPALTAKVMAPLPPVALTV